MLAQHSYSLGHLPNIGLIYVTNASWTDIMEEDYGTN